MVSSPLSRRSLRSVLLAVSLVVLGVAGAASPRESASALAADTDVATKSSRLVRRESSRRVAVDAKGQVEHAAVAATAAVAPLLPAAETELPLGQPASFADEDASVAQTFSGNSTDGELSGPGPQAEGAEAELLEASALERNPSDDEITGDHEPAADGGGHNASEHNASEPEAFYLKKESRRCGECGAMNDLHIGFANSTSDTVAGGEVLEICGGACNRHTSCGGFVYLRPVGRCYYRRSTACEESPDLDRDCYVKVPPALLQDMATDK